MPYYLDDIRKVFAHLYQICKGKSNLIPYECVRRILLNPLGFGLKDEEFKELIQNAIDRKLITILEQEARGRFVRLLFDPSDYYTKEKPTLRKYKDIGYELEEVIKKHTGKEREHIRKRIMEISEYLNISYPIAAYILAKSLGIDVSEFEKELWSFLSRD